MAQCPKCKSLEILIVEQVKLTIDAEFEVDRQFVCYECKDCHFEWS